MVDNEVVSIDLDLVLEEGDLDALRERWEPVKLEVVNPEGPGGGNPIVRLTGTKAELKLWVVENYLTRALSIEDQEQLAAIDRGGWYDPAALDAEEQALLGKRSYRDLR